MPVHHQKSFDEALHEAKREKGGFSAKQTTEYVVLADPTSLSLLAGAVMQPQELIDNHPITLQLKNLGLTDEQLDGLRFRGSNKGWEFDLWPITWRQGTPTENVVHLFKPFCALKWLLLENPAPSRNREDAWQLVAVAAAAPIFEIGQRAKTSQQKRATKPRGKLGDHGLTMRQIICELQAKPERCEETAEALWPHFLADLRDVHQVDPVEISHPTNTRNRACEYDLRDGRKRITFGRFANVVASCRRKSR